MCVNLIAEPSCGHRTQMGAPLTLKSSRGWGADWEHRELRVDCECGRCEERKLLGGRQGGRYEGPLYHSAFDRGLARSPIQFSPFLSEGTATELSSGQQWQTRCDQALLSAQNGSLLLPAAGFKSPRQPSRGPGLRAATPTQSGQKGTPSISLAEPLVWKRQV